MLYTLKILIFVVACFLIKLNKAYITILITNTHTFIYNSLITSYVSFIQNCELIMLYTFFYSSNTFLKHFYQSNKTHKLFFLIPNKLLNSQIVM